MTFLNQSHNENLTENISFTSNGSEREMEIPLYSYILVTFFYAVFFGFGLVGNFMVIIVVIRNATMRNSTNICLLNLSVADICILLVCVPTALSEFYGKDVWYLGAVMCKIVPYLENTVALSSALTILAISFERYYAICCPLQAQYKCTLRRTVKIIFIIWLVSFVLNMPFILITFIEDTTSYDNKEIQVCRTHIAGTLQQAFVIGLSVIGLVIPIIILVVLYGCIIKELTGERFEHSPNGGCRNMSPSSRRQRKQVVVMLIAVIILFFISILPFRVISLWLVYADTQDIVALGLEAYLNLLSFARVMFYLNSAVNPAVYNLFSSKFRSAFWNLTLSIFRREKEKFECVAMSTKHSHHTLCKLDNRLIGTHV